MAKLQLYISKSLRGYENLVNFNPTAEIRRHVVDLRPALQSAVFPTNRQETLFIISYIEGGTFLSIVRTLQAAASDYIAATIYIADALVIDPAKLITVIDSTKEILERPSFNTDSTLELRAIYSENYQSDEKSAMRLYSHGREFAACFFGGKDQPSFKEFALRRFYQPDFVPFAAVILINSNSETTWNGITLKLHKPQDSITLPPPGNTPEGFAPQIYHHPFDHPCLVPVGQEIEIVWRKSGFESLRQKVLVDSPDFKFCPPDTRNQRKLVSKATFYVTTQGTHTVLAEYDVKVNGIDIDAVHPFTHSDLVNAKVEIFAQGHTPFIGHIDLSSSVQAVVQLKETCRSYRFSIPVKGPEATNAIVFHIQSKKRLTASPVEGYDIAADNIQEGSYTNNLVYGSKNKYIRLAIAAAIAGIIIGIAIGWAIFKPEQNRHKAPVIIVKEAPAPLQQTITEQIQDTLKTENTQEPKPAEQSFNQQAATEYLDSHKNWNLDEMENLGMAQLFHALNNYDFHTVNTQWADKLQNSKAFAQISKAIANSHSKRDPRTGNHAPKYLADGDKQIHWRSYTYWIDP